MGVVRGVVYILGCGMWVWLCGHFRPMILNQPFLSADSTALDRSGKLVSKKVIEHHLGSATRPPTNSIAMAGSS